MTIFTGRMPWTIAGHAALWAWCLLPLTSATASASDRPNIVFLFADDLGYADLGCYGHPYAKTPAIDRLAKEGARFTQFYVTGVTCNPSRTGLMTGRFPARFPKYAADYGFADSITITELLHQHGYQTGHFGKWHIGPVSANGTYGIDDIQVIGKSRGPSAGRDDDLYSSAIQFIREHQDKPFYVNVWGHATHYPVDTPQSLVQPFAGVAVARDDFSPTMQHKFDECQQAGGNLNEAMRQYLGDVHQIDRNVSRILDTLDELGLRQNTIVVFSSDHGPAPVALGNKGIREFSQNMLGYAGAFRGGKHQQYEGGVRVPFIIRWPDQIEAGRVDTSSVFSFIDWLPTLCAAADISELPNNLDGENILDIWRGTTRSRLKPLMWKVSAKGGAPAIRDGRWKLHMNRRNAGGPELYDLTLDPSESQNIAEDHPNVVRDLRNKLSAWESELPSSYEKSNQRKTKERKQPQKRNSRNQQ